jgi:hypothetical protein
MRIGTFVKRRIAWQGLIEGNGSMPKTATLPHSSATSPKARRNDSLTSGVLLAEEEGSKTRAENGPYQPARLLHLCCSLDNIFQADFDICSRCSGKKVVIQMS